MIPVAVRITEYDGYNHKVDYYAEKYCVIRSLFSFFWMCISSLNES